MKRKLIEETEHIEITTSKSFKDNEINITLSGKHGQGEIWFTIKEFEDMVDIVYNMFVKHNKIDEVLLESNNEKA